MQDGKKNASESLNEQSAKDTEQSGASEGAECAKGPKEPKNSEAQEAGKPSAESAKSDAQPSDKTVKEASAQETSDRTVSDGASDAKPAAKAADSTESTEPAKEADSEKEPKQSSSKQPVKSAETETADKAKSEDKAKKPAQGEKEDQGDKGKVLAEPARFEKLRAAVLNLGWKKWTAIAVVAAVLLGAGLFLAFGTSHTIERSDRDAGENIYMVVKPGTTASEISDRLMQLGVIDSRLRFWWLMKLQGDASKFKTGTYAFTPHMDEQAVLDKLVAGDTTVVKFTIPEGLADEGLVDEQEFLAEAKDFAPYDYMKKRPNVRYAAEGYLFPDTYVIHSDVSAEGIMKMMAEDFDTRLTPALRQQAAAKGLSIHDLITLASLVEKEARYDEDRPIIAQVFFKRLQMGMPLQSDTTLQYLMAGPKEDVSIEDTKIDSPYNTYQHEGLPPGPIASPGMKSILAVLNPANTDYLYFVADRQGHNHYSQTYDEHLAIVEQVR